MGRIGVQSQKNILYIFSGIHFLAACLASRNFFRPVRDGAGSENIAYKFLETGERLSEDVLSRTLCQVYSYVLAFLLLFVFWKTVFRLVELWKKKEIPHVYLGVYVSLVLIGIAVIVIAYPETVVEATDTTWNYVYAKEWLPIYWHGYLTNVIHCACMILCPHPISMSVIPFLFGITEICYFMYLTIVQCTSYQCTSGGKAFKTILWAVFLLLMPETFRVLTYAGRNYMFALLSVGYVGTFLTDYIHKKELSKSRFMVLAVLALVLATWRSEGILYLIFFPVLIYITYFVREGKRSEVPGLKNIVKAISVMLVLYLILALPGKYGSEKYQGMDYVIINTPSPLSAVFCEGEADLTYDGAQADLNTVFSVIPRTYFEKYGRMAQFYYNFDNFWSPRQSHAGELGEKYVFASYRLLAHNLDIYLKNQINFYTGSIGFDNVFEIQEVQPEDWILNRTEEAAEWFDWIWGYFSIGENDISVNHDIVIINEGVDAWLGNLVLSALNKIYDIGWSLSGYVKITVSIAVLCICISCLLKKEWTFFFVGVLILGLLAAIILTAPTMRENYYYSPYFNQYWYLLCFICYKNKKKN